MKSNINYRTYEGFKYDAYIGKSLYIVDDCCSDQQYRIKEHLLFKNEEGILGHVGDGRMWGLCYLTQTGPYAFNPIKESELIFSNLHNAYFYKHQEQHSLFPITLGQFYFLIKGRKFLGTWKDTEILPLTNLFKER